MTDYITRRAFLDLLTAEPGSSHKDGVGLRKAYTATSVEKAEGEARTLDVTISTEAVDRERDTIAVDGWKLENYRRNPVVLWAHDYGGLPVGRSIHTEAKDGRLMASPKFAERDIYPFADTVLQMYLGGYLRAFSVGFDPSEYVMNEDRRGIDFKVQELLEFSAVPVPANPEALLGAKGAGIDLAPLVEWASEVLDKWDEDGGLIVLNRPLVERALRLAEGEKITITVPAHLSSDDSSELCKAVGADYAQVAELVPLVGGEGGTVAPPPPEPTDDDALPDSVTTTVEGCARCGEDHEGLLFLAFDAPVDEFTHWALCPKVGQPILLHITTTFQGEKAPVPEADELVDWLGLDEKAPDELGVTDDELAELVSVALAGAADDAVQQGMVKLTGRLPE